jgi:hypothetical protein
MKAKTVGYSVLGLRVHVLRATRTNVAVQMTVRRGVGFSSHFFIRSSVVQCVREDYYEDR